MRFNKFINESISKEAWENALQVNPMLRAAHDILKIINKHGFAAKIVGGSVRDLLMGKTDFHDVDISTNMPMEELDKIFHGHDIGKNRDFGIVVVNFKGFTFEIAQFRTESGYSNNRHPDEVNFVSSFKEDSSRRDFTWNSLGIDASGRIHDFHNGVNDLKKKILRTVGDPHKRFEEDALRLLRAKRFAARMGFNIAPDTMSAIRKRSDTIVNVSPERIKDELFKMASQSGPKFADAILKMDRGGLLKHILPELKALQGFREQVLYHPEVQKRSGTVFDHVIEAIKKNPIPDPIINLAIMCHDLGKGRTFKQTDHKGPTYHSHDFQSVKIIENIGKRLKFSNDEIEAIKFAAEHHMKMHKLGEMKPSKVVALMKSPHFDVLKHVAKADDSSRMRLWDPIRWEETMKLLSDIEEKWGATISGKATKLVDGNHVMKLTGLKPGKVVGDLIKAVTEYILDNNITDEKEIDSEILRLSKVI